MPASICDSVSSALRLSLTADDKTPGSLLDNRLISSAKSVLLTKIEFEEAGNYQSNLLDGLKSKYVVLKQEKRLSDDKTYKKDSSTNYACGRPKQESGLPSPKKILFPLSSVRLGWEPGWQVGSGMQNVGNTCYLNSTLQALFHVPAFSNWLMSETHHADKCTQNGGCVICGMRKTLLDTQHSGGPIKPWQVYSKLRLICRHLTLGRQEDAHEFLKYLVEAMEKTYLSQLGSPAKQLDQFSKETTPMNQILGGYLRSAVRCLACGHVSTTFQHFQDLLVDARKASTIDEALDSFFSRERLEDLGYKCESCNKKVSATKQFFVERAPMVLCIALKRFSLTGGKLSKHVQFKTRLSMKKFMFNQGSQATLAYRLVSVVTHLGPSQNCGHYTAVGLGPAGTFYQFDDSCVRAIPVSNVLGTNAYIMFYELEKQSTSNGIKAHGQVSPVKAPLYSKKENDAVMSNFIGPVIPDGFKNKDCSSAKSKLSPLKINCGSDMSPKQSTSDNSSFKSLLTYRPNENGHSSSSLSLSMPALTSSINGESSHNGSNNKINGNGKAPHTTDNNSIRKAISDVLSPSKSNGIRNGTSGHSFQSDVKIATFDGKLNDQNKVPNTQNGNTNANADFRLKNKISNGDTKSGANHNKTNTNNIYVKSPLNSNDSNHSKQSGSNGLNGTTKHKGLVPYDSESGGETLDGDEEEYENLGKPQNQLTPQVSKSPITPKATVPGWKVSSDVPVSQHSPSLNGVVNNKLVRSSETYVEQPTVLSSTSQNDVVGQLQRLSHRGYGAPINTWNGTHAQLNRQVFEDKKNQLKRAADADDEMDRGRTKKVRHNNYNNKYYNGNNGHSNSGFNGFQDVQNNRIRWGEGNGGKNCRGYYNKNFRHRPRGRFVSHYPRHHSNNHHHHHYNRNH